METILLLGGSYGQISAVKDAKKRNLYTILCDYPPDNPGQFYADEFYNISTTGTKAVLSLSQKKEIGYIFACMSDSAVLTTAYAAEKFGLRGNKPESIKLLLSKDESRKFMKKHGFNTPAFIVADKQQIQCCSITDLEFPLVVRPVDSSDTKGVHKINKKEEFL